MHLYCVILKNVAHGERLIGHRISYGLLYTKVCSVNIKATITYFHTTKFNKNTVNNFWNDTCIFLVLCLFENLALKHTVLKFHEVES